MALEASEQPQIAKDMEAVSTFIGRSIHSGILANIFVVIDTQADRHTGRLQYMRGSTKLEIADSKQGQDDHEYGAEICHPTSVWVVPGRSRLPRRMAGVS